MKFYYNNTEINKSDINFVNNDPEHLFIDGEVVDVEDVFVEFEDFDEDYTTISEGILNNHYIVEYDGGDENASIEVSVNSKGDDIVSAVSNVDGFEFDLNLKDEEKNAIFRLVNNLHRHLVNQSLVDECAEERAKFARHGIKY